MTTASSKPPFYRDVRVLRIVGQTVAVVAVLWTLRWLFNNLTSGLEALNIGTGFEFLNQPTNFKIPFDPGFESRSPVWRMLLVGLKNTLLASVVGITIASVLGLIVGVARLSKNWLIGRFAALYVETLRNIPPLIIIAFFGFAVFFFGPFPLLKEAWQYQLPGSDNSFLLLSKDQSAIPSFIANDNSTLYWVVLLIGLLVALAVARWRTKVNEDTGADHHRVLWSAGVFLAIAVVGFVVLGRPLSMSWPSLSENARRIEGGFATNWGYLSLTVALGLYTASHIAEIIRGSILAVAKGQTEAAEALALSGFQRYRYVVLPQAMRIAIPSIINQFLNLVKNTSLATVVAYADVTALTKSSIGNGRPAPQSILVLMAIYLSFSLIISFVLNQANKRLQIAGR